MSAINWKGRIDTVQLVCSYYVTSYFTNQYSQWRAQKLSSAASQYFLPLVINISRHRNNKKKKKRKNYFISVILCNEEMKDMKDMKYVDRQRQM